MPAYAYAIIAAGWITWVTPFFLVKRRNAGTAHTLDRRARWGILLEGIGYSLLWQNRFWLRSPEDWRIVLSVVFFGLAAVLSWTSARALGRQWRIDAGLNAGHELVRSGALQRCPAPDLYIDAMPAARHRIYDHALADTCRVNIVVYCRNGDPSPYRRQAACVAFRRRVSEVSTRRFSLHPIHQIWSRP